MTHQPFIKWYPTDWRADPKLRMCSLAARGLWIELIGYMHEGEPYGHLTINDTSPSTADISALVGRPMTEVRKALGELEARQVYSIDETGRMFSRRMVRDKAKAEKDRENGKGGGNPKLKGGVNPQDKAQIPEARSQIPEKKTRSAVASDRDENFEAFWAAYPGRQGDNPKAPSAKLFSAAVKAGADPQEIIDAAKKFASAEQRNIGTQFIPQTVKWLRNKRWLDFGPSGAGGNLAAVFDIRSHLV